MILPGMGSVMAGLSKSAPVLRGSVQSAAIQTGSTSWEPDLAAHEAGDVLVVLVANNGGLDMNASLGWSSVTSHISGTTRLTAFRRTAVSSATTLTLTFADVDSTSFAAHSYALEFTDGDVEGERVAGSRNPPSLTPTWGSETNFWIAAHAGDSLPLTGPTDFANGTQTTSGSLYLSTMDRSVDAPTLNPSAFSGSDDGDDVSLTIAVRPA